MFRLIIILSFILFVRIILFSPQPQQYTFQNNQNSNLDLFSKARGDISDKFYKVLPRDEAALLLGIVLGEKGDFEKNYFAAFKKTGVMHIIAASGMNISMFSAFLVAILIVFLKRQYALIFASAGIILYAAMAGFQPSIIRASIMGIMAFGAGIFGRQNTSLFALFLAFSGMVIINPEIISNIGFELSFAATAGIIFLDPIFKKIMRQGVFAEDLRTTLSAQIATVPILLFFFGAYSPISIVTNFLVLWTVPPLMVLGGIASLLSFLPALSLPFLYLSLPLLLYFKFVVLYLSEFAFGLNISSPPWTLVIGYYLILLSVILLVYKRNKISI